MVKPIEKVTIIRTLFLVLALINQILVTFGKSPLPIDEEGLEIVISTIWVGVASIWAWWKNNNFTKQARTEK